MTATHKIVNGKPVVLTPEEISEIETEWAAPPAPARLQAAAKRQANNQATLIVGQLFVDLIEALLANATIAATDFPLETRQEYQALKGLIDDWRALP